MNGNYLIFIKRTSEAEIANDKNFAFRIDSGDSRNFSMLRKKFPSTFSSHKKKISTVRNKNMNNSLSYNLFQ